MQWTHIADYGSPCFQTSISIKGWLKWAASKQRGNPLWNWCLFRAKSSALLEEHWQQVTPKTVRLNAKKYMCLLQTNIKYVHSKKLMVSSANSNFTSFQSRIFLFSEFDHTNVRGGTKRVDVSVFGPWEATQSAQICQGDPPVEVGLGRVMGQQVDVDGVMAIVWSESDWDVILFCFGLGMTWIVVLVVDIWPVVAHLAKMCFDIVQRLLTCLVIRESMGGVSP